MTHSTAAGAASSRTYTVTAAAPLTRCTGHGAPCTPALTCSRPNRPGACALVAVQDPVEVQATWGIYQRMISAYREPDRQRGRNLMTDLIAAISSGVPKDLVQVIRLGRTIKQRAQDVLAYFQRPGPSNGLNPHALTDDSNRSKARL